MNPSDLSDVRFRSFVQNKVFLVADTSPRVLEYISTLLTSMGIPLNSLILTTSFNAARSEINRAKPHIVLSDYDMDKKCGLGLIEVQRKVSTENKDALFILVTGNTSQIAVARAAEEEVDGYVLKPFTGGILREAILKAAATKFDPSEYEKLIGEGKALIASSALDEAERTLEIARQKNSTPALALYYLGQIELLRKNSKKAQEKFQQGLKANRIHYKCMVGLYEALYEQKEYSEAYATLKRVSRYFPLEAPHLASMLKLSIQTKTYEDIERLYRIFQALEEKNEELIKYVCAALVVCGKYYLQKTFRSRALELFQHAIQAAEKNPRILKEVILILAESQLKKEAELFIQFFPANSRESNDYQIARIAVADLTLKAEEVISIGQEILAKNCHDSSVYLILIRRMVQTLNIDGARELAEQATQKWPEQRDRFLALLDVIDPVGGSGFTPP